MKWASFLILESIPETFDYLVDVANAPLTGDRTAWKPRLAKGESTLLQSVLTGFNGMPAGGQCFTCTPHDYDALIAFMADGDGR